MLNCEGVSVLFNYGVWLTTNLIVVLGSDCPITLYYASHTFIF